MTLIQQLTACGAVASRLWPWRKLYYALKTAILTTYGQPDGYDLQVFYKPGFYDLESEGTEHRHILKRYTLNDAVFHIPTDEFAYFNLETQNGRQSDNYTALKESCQNIIEGRKPYLVAPQDTLVAWICLKSLVREHGHLLRGKNPQLPLPFREGESAVLSAGVRS